MNTAGWRHENSTPRRTGTGREVAAETARDKPNKYSPGMLASLIAWVERLNIRHSPLGAPAVYDPADFPWSREVQAEWRTIRRELDRILEVREELPSFHEVTDQVSNITSDNRWKTFFLAGYGIRPRENTRICPETCRILRRIPGMKTAFFSILAPGKQIPVHKGAYNGVLRYHLALKVPREKEKCRLWIDGETMHWSEGDALIFDDTFDHSVSNDTPDYRVVLFVDFERPVRFPFSLFNKFVLRIAPELPVLRSARRNHERWERKFYRRRKDLVQDPPGAGADPAGGPPPIDVGAASSTRSKGSGGELR